MEFESAEIEDRIAKARALMEHQQLDCLLLTGVENVSYFTGISTALYQSRRPWVVLLPAAGDPIAFMKAGPVAISMAAGSIVRDVEEYPFPVSGTLPRQVTQRLRSLGVRRVGSEIGLEMRINMPLADYWSITEALDDVEFVDAAALIWSLRINKSRAEAARMREACEITSSTRQSVFRELLIGMSEQEIAANWQRKMYQAGADRPSFIYVNSGSNYNLLPSSKTISAGDTVWLDGGAYVGGYTCDFSRVAIMGEPSARQRQLHRDATEVTDLLVSRVAPGVRVADLAVLSAQEMERRGYLGPSSVGGMVAGHGMGMLINEPPLIAPWSDYVIREGDLIGVELGPVDECGLFIWEQLVHVGPESGELISPESSDLVVVDI